MQIVVTISEREYLLMKTFLESGMGNDAMRKICNGTILPKGHGRLIDADALEPDESGEWNGLCVTDDKYKQRTIDNAPTVVGADKESEEV